MGPQVMTNFRGRFPIWVFYHHPVWHLHRQNPWVL